MFTYRKYLTILSLFLAACSVSKEKVSIIHEPLEKEIISQSQIESSENGINNFIDGMMFMEQGEYARAIIEFQEAIDKGLFDDLLKVAGPDGIAWAKRLASEEGIFTGVSGGSSLAVGIEVAKSAPAGSNILCMLPDTGERYLSTPLFDGIEEEMSEDEIALSHSTPGYQLGS